MANYCHNCGTELSGSERYCPVCGTHLATDEPVDVEGADPAPSAPSDSPDRPSQPAGGDRGAYLASIGGFVVTVALFGVVVVGTPAEPPETVDPAWGYVALLLVIAWFASIVAMYADLRSLDRRLWRLPPVAWAVAAVLLYVFVIPIYGILRRQAVSGN